eukprot:COSAG04_NODE_248_length_18898_cov_16.838715_5_plen_49_part_00
MMIHADGPAQKSAEVVHCQGRAVVLAILYTGSDAGTASGTVRVRQLRE